MKRITESLVFTMLLLFPLFAFATDGNEQLSYQGSLFGEDGEPLNANVTITFRLYEVLEGGALLWSEALSINVEEGFFSVPLGSSEPFPVGLFDRPNLFLEIVVDGDVLEPRQSVNAVVWARKAFAVEGDVNATSVSVGGEMVIDDDGKWTGDPTGLQGEPGDDGADGRHCWDLNENDACELATEDQNEDEECSVLDCKGTSGENGEDGADGRHCWDLNENNACDLEAEDINEDEACDVLDCKGAPGENGEDGADGYQCWDANLNHTCDTETEDLTDDGACTLADCKGAKGDKGDTGDDGTDGADGVDCWDLNGDHECDLETEDKNGDNGCTALDCAGPQGEPGEDGENGVACWDRNANGTCDVGEDQTDDELCTVADCNAEGAGVASDVICSGCVDSEDVGFSYAGAASKGGPAASALTANTSNDLVCSGCVSEEEVAFNICIADETGQALTAAHADTATSATTADTAASATNADQLDGNDSTHFATASEVNDLNTNLSSNYYTETELDGGALDGRYYEKATADATFALVTALNAALDRLDTAEQNISDLQAENETLKNEECPPDYEKVTDASIPATGYYCRKAMGGGKYDEMVKVGDFWVDRYESSLWSGSDCTGTQYGKAEHDAHNAGFTRNATDSTIDVTACSVEGVEPSRWITWFQAQAACGAAGKVLCTNEQWQLAANGTPDPHTTDPGDDSESCNIWENSKPNGSTWGTTNQTIMSGTATQCVSRFGAYDMVGNVWEWTGGWNLHGGASSPDGNQPNDGEFKGDGYWNVDNAQANGSYGEGNPVFPASALRGGNWHSGSKAGVFALDLSRGPANWDDSLGARCCRR